MRHPSFAWVACLLAVTISFALIRMTKFERWMIEITEMNGVEAKLAPILAFDATD
ncbi:hypothetical protein [Burkholderia oklahomensis]|uniref:Methyl-accepting chemotaxis domain protein n=1 Tax=Burkholderia oklahomensis TaxID=342113 RepID=A0AAI8BBU7_9BURK|nr:methyl-accepting chemotaxis domain protein [Burkholderia oklahomensis]AJX34687.1 putative methyl-accepting chemotaxis protein [Burkholderia oklahomensis C6786]AOI38493.1 chemotaxis protein [Burkholderia oklahomensis EO147]AOI48211.1 chemotaxis protein [Burkholderia oklahomensis C6786]KUY48386.1 chemotaxis protein [Burkholderia oklahomensis EO147]